MTDLFVDKSKAEMGTIERLLKGLPVIRGYVDKELRREADYRLRQTIAGTLENEKQRLFNVQQSLLSKGGLLFVDDVDRAVQKLQTLTDRIRTASYGYAGLFDAVRVKEDQLDALHRFDVGVAARTYEISAAIDRLSQTVNEGAPLNEPLAQLNAILDELTQLYNRRHQAILDPDLLTGDAAPAVSDAWMQAADNYRS
jgi:hypothetical protein